MQSIRCYHGLTSLFNHKALGLRVDLGMLKVSLAFAKYICLLFTEAMSERMALDYHLTTFLFSLYNLSAHRFPKRKRNIEAAPIT